MESAIKKIEELVKEETNITIKVKILSISQKEANTQRGKNRNDSKGFYSEACIGKKMQMF